MKKLALLVLAGCSTVPQGVPDADLAACQIAGNLDELIVTAQHAEAQDEFVGLTGALEPITPDALPDAFSLELYQGSGVFADTPIAPGPYTVEDQYRTCGLCVLIYTDYDHGAIGQTFLATTGTVVITEVDERLTGTITNAELHQVTLDDDLTSTEVMGGCVTTLPSLAFDAEIMR